MPSTYTTGLRLELQANGENAETWGTKSNNNLSLLEQAIAGRKSIAQGDVANLTLSANNAADDQARAMMLNFTGALTANRNVVVPTQSKVYIVTNSTTGGFGLTVKTSAGTGVTVANGKTAVLACDGTNVIDPIQSFDGQAASYYTNIVARLGYTPANKAGDTFTGDLTVPSLNVLQQGGSEGGEIILQKGSSDSIINTDVRIDIFGGQFRVFEGGGTNRGINLQLAQCAAGAASSWWHSGNFDPLTKANANGSNAFGTWGINISGNAANGGVTSVNGMVGDVVVPTGGGGGGGASGTVTSVNVSPGTTGLTVTGGPITSSGTLTLGGTLSLNHGGLGVTTAADARNVLDVPRKNGEGATGSWGVSITGNAATATTANHATTATTALNGGVTSFNGSTGAITYSAVTSINGLSSTPSIVGDVDVTGPDRRLLVQVSGNQIILRRQAPAGSPNDSLHPHSKVEMAGGLRRFAFIRWLFPKKKYIVDLRPGDWIVAENGPDEVIGMRFGDLGSKQFVMVNNSLVTTPGHLIKLANGSIAAVDPQCYAECSYGKLKTVKSKTGMVTALSEICDPENLVKLEVGMSLARGKDEFEEVSDIHIDKYFSENQPTIAVLLRKEKFFRCDGWLVGTLA